MLQATADTYVRDGSYANTNFGTSTTLLAKDAIPGDGYVRTTYIKFNIPASGPITSAMLQLFGSESAGSPESSIQPGSLRRQHQLQPSTITDANAPPLGTGGPLTTFAVSGTTASTWLVNLTTYLQQLQQQGATSVGLAITGNGLYRRVGPV